MVRAAVANVYAQPSRWKTVLEHIGACIRVQSQMGNYLVGMELVTRVSSSR